MIFCDCMAKIPKTYFTNTGKHSGSNSKSKVLFRGWQPRFAPGFFTVGNCRGCACSQKWRPMRLITHQVMGRKGCWTQCNVSPETDFQQIDNSSDIPLPCHACRPRKPQKTTPPVGEAFFLDICPSGFLTFHAVQKPSQRNHSTVLRIGNSKSSYH